MGLSSVIRRTLRSFSASKVIFVKRGPGWLDLHLSDALDRPLADCPEVEARAIETERSGEQPLWDGYVDVPNYPRDTTGRRTSNQVRTDAETGKLFAYLAAQLAPEIIVEFGTAFGVSGMFWLAGLERAGGGTLMTYEPNSIWSAFARDNLAAISSRFVLTEGAFEEKAASTLDIGSVGLAFIDAIHTEEFVLAQFAILRPYMRTGGIVIFDDIDFSDSMRRCWTKISTLPDITASAKVNRRVGIIEL